MIGEVESKNAGRLTYPGFAALETERDFSFSTDCKECTPWVHGRVHSGQDAFWRMETDSASVERQGSPAGGKSMA